MRWDDVMNKWEEDKQIFLNSSQTAINYDDRRDPQYMYIIKVIAL